MSDAVKPLTGEEVMKAYHGAKTASLGPTKDDAVKEAWDFVAAVANVRIETAARAGLADRDRLAKIRQVIAAIDIYDEDANHYAIKEITTLCSGRQDGSK